MRVDFGGEIATLRLPVKLYRLWPLVALCRFGICTSFSQPTDFALAQKQWFETRTAHFNIYGYNALRGVNKLAARLEQFCEAYSLLEPLFLPNVDPKLRAQAAGMVRETGRN